MDKRQKEIFDEIAAHLAYCEELAMVLEDETWENDYADFEDCLKRIKAAGKVADEPIEKVFHAGDCVSLPITCYRCLCESYRDEAKIWLHRFGVNVDWEKTPVTPETANGRMPREIRI